MSNPDRAVAIRYRLGFDLGGTKPGVPVLDPDQRPIYRQRVHTPAYSYDEILAMTAGLVIEAGGSVKQEMVIGIPGAVSPATGLLRNSSTVCLNGRPFHGDIGKLLQRRIRVDNDANCFTRASPWTRALERRDSSGVYGAALLWE